MDIQKLTKLLPSFSETTDPKDWLRAYITAPLKLAPELEEPLKTVCQELSKPQTNSSEELRALDEALNQLKKKWTDGFLEASKEADAAMEKWEAELALEVQKGAELKEEKKKLASIIDAHLKSTNEVLNLIDDEGAEKTEKACSSAKQRIKHQVHHQQCKIVNLQWRVTNARQLFKTKWMNTLSNFASPALPASIKYLAAPRYLFFKYSSHRYKEVSDQDSSNDSESSESVDDTYNYYQVTDVKMGYDPCDSLWKKRGYWRFKMEDIKHFGLERKSLVEFEIQLKGAKKVHYLRLQIPWNINDDAKEIIKDCIYWIDYKPSRDGVAGCVKILGEQI